MKALILRLCALIAVLLFISYGAAAQEISGFSTIGVVSVCTGINCGKKGVATTYVAQVSAYIDTEEDYTASLYYDVSSVSAAYYGGSPTPLISGSITGNPSATATDTVPGTVLNGTVRTSHTLAGIAPYGPRTYVSDITPGIFTEATDHVVDFFYVTSVGEYYDPYGFSVVNGDGGDYNSGYWFDVTV